MPRFFAQKIAQRKFRQAFLGKPVRFVPFAGCRFDSNQLFVRANVFRSRLYGARQVVLGPFKVAFSRQKFPKPQRRSCINYGQALSLFVGNASMLSFP